MLIIAIPKSGSASLMRTFGITHNLKAKQQDFSNNKKLTNIKLLHNYHCDIRQLTNKEVQLFKSSKHLYKLHIPPSPHNIKMLSKQKKVILLRPIEDIIKAYRRAEFAGIHKTKVEFNDCKSDQEWIKRAKENGLYSDLQFFHDNWLDYSKKDTNSIVISYSNLIHNTEQTFNKLEKFWGLETTKHRVVLLKVNYSREPLQPKITRKLKQTVGYILSKLLLKRF